MRRNVMVRVALSAIAVVGSGAYVFTQSILSSESLEYFHPVDTVVAQGSGFRGQKMRMGGYVKDGSILQKPGTFEYQFEVLPIAGMLKHPELKDTSVVVRYEGIVPDNFKNGAEVIVAGVLTEPRSFQAREIIAKCPSKYEAQEKGAGRY
jgi:cytochrome c-type biogenesis protein CcmE